MPPPVGAFFMTSEDVPRQRALSSQAVSPLIPAPDLHLYVDGVSQCLQCRDPLVVSVNKSLCLTTAEYQSDPCLVQNELFRLEELAIEQRAEEAAEVRSQAIIKDRLAISLPVVCFMMILFCVLMSVFAHWRTEAEGKGLGLRGKGWVEGDGVEAQSLNWKHLTLSENLINIVSIDVDGGSCLDQYIVVWAPDNVHGVEWCIQLQWGKDMRN
eukprot:Em0020g427a